MSLTAATETYHTKPPPLQPSPMHAISPSCGKKKKKNSNRSNNSNSSDKKTLSIDRISSWKQPADATDTSELPGNSGTSNPHTKRLWFQTRPEHVFYEPHAYKSAEGMMIINNWARKWIQYTHLTNPTLHQISHNAPFCKRNVDILQNDALWNMALEHGGICAIGLFLGLYSWWRHDMDWDGRNVFGIISYCKWNVYVDFSIKTQ